jgi:putative nucleotidyltransferase-like protein
MSFAQVLAERRLLPLIGSRAVECGAIEDAAFARAVDGSRRQVRLENLQVEAVTGRAVRVLADRGIRALPLKGPRLAERCHGDTGLRSSNDVDLLVAREELFSAVSALRREGFDAPPDTVGRGGLPQLHFELSSREGPAVEVHWRVHWYEEDFSRELLAAADPGDAGMLDPQREHDAALLLLFFARDGFHGLRLAADIGAWWDRYGQDAGRGCLDATAARHPSLRRPLVAAARVAEWFTGVRRDAWLSGAEPHSRRTELACRLADWSGAGERDQLAANISLVDGLLVPPRGIPAFVQRQLLDPRDGGGLHALKVGLRYAMALPRVRGGPWTPLPAL